MLGRVLGGRCLASPGGVTWSDALQHRFRRCEDHSRLRSGEYRSLAPFPGQGDLYAAVPKKRLGQAQYTQLPWRQSSVLWIDSTRRYLHALIRFGCRDPLFSADRGELRRAGSSLLIEQLCVKNCSWASL